MSNDAFLSLQNSIISDNNFDPNLLRDALLFDYNTPEAFSTIRLALLTKRISSNKLFGLSVRLSLDVNPIYLRYVGLALRHGANPNGYIKADFNIRNKIENVPIHIAKFIWDLTPKSIDDVLDREILTYGTVNTDLSDEDLTELLVTRQQVSLAILSMMAIKGMVLDSAITNSKLLLEAGFDATLFISANPDFMGSVYGSIAEYPGIGDRFLSEIKIFWDWRNRLQDLYGRNPKLDPKILEYAFYLDITSILTLSDVYPQSGEYSKFLIENTEEESNLEAMFYMQNNKALEFVISALKELKYDEPQQKKLELKMLNWTTAYYNQKALGYLLEQGVEIDMFVRSQTIRKSKIICSDFPLQCEILNSMIIKYVKYGYGLSIDQLNELKFSPKTQNAVKEAYQTPQWEYMCSVRSNKLHQDLAELGRQVGIPIGSSKEQICDTLVLMSKGNPSELKQASMTINRNRISVLTTSAADVVSGRKILKEPRTLPNMVDNMKKSPQTLSTNSNSMLNDNNSLCTNYDSLLRPIEDYPEEDRVVYSDGDSTWCFTSDHYRNLLSTKTNPWAYDPTNNSMGAPLPPSVLDEMQQKLDRIVKSGLSERAQSISDGIDKIYNTDLTQSIAYYENESNRELKSFLEFMEYKGIPKDTFLTLSSSDYQILADSVLSNQTRVLVDESSPMLALRDFSSAVISESKYFQNSEELGDTIKSIILESRPELE